MFNEKFEKCLITFLPVRLITLKNMYDSDALQKKKISTLNTNTPEVLNLAQIATRKQEKTHVGYSNLSLRSF